MGGVGAAARLLPASSICSPSHTRQFAREMLYIFSAASPSAARFSHQTKRMKSSVHITLSFFIMQTQKRIEMITHQLSKHRRSTGASCVIRAAANHVALLVPRILILRRQTNHMTHGNTGDQSSVKTGGKSRPRPLNLCDQRLTIARAWRRRGGRMLHVIDRSENQSLPSVRRRHGAL